VGEQVFEPRSFVISARDSGKFDPNPDALGFELSSASATESTCTTQFPPTHLVREGEVVVKDSLG
jgi:hypothetical protein